jgi:hypothetical protein
MEATAGPVRVPNPDFLFGGRTSASAECRHWSGRAVRWSSSAILLSGEVGQRTGRPKVVPDKNDIPSAADLGLTRNPVRARAAWLRTRFPPRYPPVFHRLYSACLQALPVGNLQTCTANNLQQSWRFDWEPPKAVLRDVFTIVWILGC